MVNFHDLQKIGLTEGESKVYIALSKIGTSTVGPIVDKAGVAYSNVYDILNRLIEKGIVSFVVKNKTKYFQAVSPKNLLDFINKKEEELASQRKTLVELMPKLEQIQNLGPKQNAEIFIGKKGLKTAYEKLLTNDKRYENCFFYIHKERYAKESDLFYLSIRELLNKVSERGITNVKSKESSFFKNNKKIKMKYVDFPLPGNMEVCNNKTLVVSWSSEIVSILIESEDIANNFRNYFNAIWNQN